MKPYNNWLIVSYSGVLIMFLHLISRYVGIGINRTPSAPEGIYIYYPIYGELKLGDKVDFSLTAQQAQKAHHCIPKGQYGLKQIGARPGLFLLRKRHYIYVCKKPASHTKLSPKNCQFLGVCLTKDRHNRPLPCQNETRKAIKPLFFYLRSVFSDQHDHINGCDSRYFGLIKRNQMHHRLIYIPFHSPRYLKPQFTHLIFPITLGLVFPMFAYSDLISIHKEKQRPSAERGYWFYQDTPHVELNKPSLLKCKKAEHWTVRCGFIDPSSLHLTGQAAYQFEQTQYHALLNDYALRPNNLEAVLHWQQFNQWVIHQSVTAAYAMQFTLSQHPELNDTLDHPFSQLGRLVLHHIETKNRNRLLAWLSKSSFLVFFSRSSCPYCKAQAPIIHMLNESTGIPVWNASLDSSPLPNFHQALTAPTTLKPARFLKVQVVPTLFLYLPRENLRSIVSGIQNKKTAALSLPSKKGGIWLRLATGLTPEKTIEDRLVNFVLAYRQALLDGLHSGLKKTPSDQLNPIRPNFSHLLTPGASQ